jgi:hypothetical protein
MELGLEFADWTAGVADGVGVLATFSGAFVIAGAQAAKNKIEIAETKINLLLMLFRNLFEMN